MKTFYRMLTTSLCCLTTLIAMAQGPNESGQYYKTTDGKKGQELKTALANIILPHKQLSYAKVWEAYKTTDVRDDGYIWDMYSCVTNFVPGDDQNRSGHAKEGDNYDREHSFPKSWFGGKVYPMFTDIFHLYPVDGYTNGRRSNNPYGEVAYLTWSTAEEFSKLGTATSTLGYSGTVFEPNDEYKGDLARTYFYMVTCYEEQLNTWQYAENVMLDKTPYPAFENWALRMLLRWAQSDPVSDKERARNDAVYEIQGNRNPFIDYPGLEQYIWGTAKESTFSYDYYEGVKQGEAIDIDPIGGGSTEEPDDIDEDDILLNNEFFNVEWKGARAASDPTNISGEQDGVNVIYDKGKGSSMYCNDTQIRLYQQNTLTMSVENNSFTDIEFTVTYNKGDKALAANVGEMNGFSWTGDASEVVFTVNNGSGHLRITGVSYTLATPSEPTGVAPVGTQRQQSVGIYSPDGRKLNEMQRGLNIIRLPDGRTLKVIR